ncbi:hypothetical protein J1614_009867, partial [Plenodomus biglobosus]
RRHPGTPGVQMKIFLIAMTMIRSGTNVVRRLRRARPKITRPWYPCKRKNSVYPKRRTVVSMVPADANAQKRRYFFRIRDAVKCSL